MRIPILQKLLTKLLIEDLPGLMVLPNRLEIVIPPSITTVAEAAVGREAIMQAVASAVLQVFLPPHLLFTPSCPQCPPMPLLGPPSPPFVLCCC